MATSTADAERDITTIVREHYGAIARAGSGCCGSAEDQSRRIGYTAEDLSTVPAEANLGVGCGAPLKYVALRAGETVLDLGSGAGFDSFLAAREVKETGRVIGVDMTPEMLERARRNAATGGYRNVEFREGRIEALPVETGVVDAVISNCVINLVREKATVYREIARVLRPGGRMVVSDIVLDAPLPAAIAESVAAWTACVAGASLRSDYLATIVEVGLIDVEVLEDRDFRDLVAGLIPAEMLRGLEAAGVDVAKIAATVHSLTIRAWKPRLASDAVEEANCPRR